MAGGLWQLGSDFCLQLLSLAMCAFGHVQRIWFWAGMTLCGSCAVFRCGPFGGAGREMSLCWHGVWSARVWSMNVECVHQICHLTPRHPI